jgi:hypothetical protein
MAQLKLASTKITPELLERLSRYTESTGVNQSAAIRQAIELFLDSVESTKSTELTQIEGNLKPSQLVERVDARLTDFEARLELLESRSVMTTVEPIAVVVTKSNTTPKSNTKKAPAPAPAPDGAMMTIGELHSKIHPSPYPYSLKTLSRRINESITSEQLLIALGIRADWQAKAKANQFSNQVRWLSIQT